MSKEREVSGKIISTDDACNWNLTVGALKDYDHVYVNGVRYVEFQPEQTEQEPVGYLYKQMDCHGGWATIFKVDKPYITWHDIKDIVPVYTTPPPKREPLSDDEMRAIWKEGIRGEIPFVEIGRAIEKAHGIGGE